jgi:hypothetical protein
MPGEQLGGDFAQMATLAGIEHNFRHIPALNWSGI